jgi:hypothetical protein
LLAEKASWVSNSASADTSNPTSDDAKRVWEVEKTELIKARDEAVSSAKVKFPS